MTIERLTGRAPPTCPWRVFEEPIVLDVLHGHWWLDSGQIGMRFGDDPPNAIIEGIEDFGGALNACEHDRYSRQRDALKNRGKTPPKPTGRSTPRTPKR